MTIKDRLNLVKAELHLSGRQLEKECNLATGSYSSLGDGMGIDKLHKILSRFPQISAEWLLTGRGEMFNSATPDTQSIDNNTDSSSLLAIITKQAATIKSQQALIEALHKQHAKYLHLLAQQQHLIETYCQSNVQPNHAKNATDI